MSLSMSPHNYIDGTLGSLANWPENSNTGKASIVVILTTCKLNCCQIVSLLGTDLT